MRNKLPIPIFSLGLLVCFTAVMAYNNIFLPQEEKMAEGETAGLLQTSSEELAVNFSSDLSEDLRQDTNVLLTVDTEKINEGNKEEMVLITDDRSDPSENSRKPSDHVALVDKNMKIYWSAEPLDPDLGTTVDVLGIFRKTDGGAEILEGVFRDPNRDGIIMGKIKNKKVQGLEYYNILIRVNGETPETFLIDPKIRMTD
ncbi:hypothetical protein [Salinimicrobium sp. HB62]|uniref:hypothetical protein n=1 Tax=Salinimicrobium sp. HB62 TaxID=3077781 RepID=UPI002D790B28|nr:hypothetical protein [Salinimicrobium sp. HB62]